MTTKHLLDEFPPVSTEAWEEVIRKDLKGADYAKKLIWQTEEGLAVKPYYRAEDTAGLKGQDAAPGSFPYLRGTQTTGGWRIREEIDLSEIGAANEAAKTAVVAGAEEIAFTHVAIHSAAELAALLANLQEIAVNFPNADEALLRLLIAYQHHAPVSTGWNPLSNLDFAAEVVRTAPALLTPFTLHAEQFEESGATAVQEIGFLLAAGIEYLAAMQERKVDINRAAAALNFSFAIGANYFFQISKLRAFRLTWAQTVESFGGSHEAAKAHLHARTSRWTETIYDPHVNVLRTTTEAMSAIIGGVNSLTVAPFDESYKQPDDASRRLARNAQLVIKKEAYFAHVADPGGGSYCIEFITDYLAREGWKTMQGIESAGGYSKAQGIISAALAKSLAIKDKAVTIRKRVFTGTNQFANLNEKALERIDTSLTDQGKRGTQSYEALRLRTERSAVKTGSSPRVLLAEIGDLKMRSARSGFAANFFGAAGLNLKTQSFKSVEEIAAAEAAVIVLCSSDAEYLALATELLTKLKTQERKTLVIVAGNPETAEQLTAAGVAEFVHVRSNPIELLTKLQQELGIKD
jgi:methylmalonyl-CoA mutase